MLIGGRRHFAPAVTGCTPHGLTSPPSSQALARRAGGDTRRRDSERGGRDPARDHPARGGAERPGLRRRRAIREARRHRALRARSAVAAQSWHRGPDPGAAKRAGAGGVLGRLLPAEARGPGPRQRPPLLRGRQPRHQAHPAGVSGRRRRRRPHDRRGLRHRWAHAAGLHVALDGVAVGRAGRPHADGHADCHRARAAGHGTRARQLHPRRQRHRRLRGRPRAPGVPGRRSRGPWPRDVRAHAAERRTHGGATRALAIHGSRHRHARGRLRGRPHLRRGLPGARSARGRRGAGRHARPHQLLEACHGGRGQSLAGSPPRDRLGRVADRALPAPLRLPGLQRRRAGPDRVRRRVRSGGRRRPRQFQPPLRAAVARPAPALQHPLPGGHVPVHRRRPDRPDHRRHRRAARARTPHQHRAADVPPADQLRVLQPRRFTRAHRRDRHARRAATRHQPHLHGVVGAAHRGRVSAGAVRRPGLRRAGRHEPARLHARHPRPLPRARPVGRRRRGAAAQPLSPLG